MIDYHRGRKDALDYNEGYDDNSKGIVNKNKLELYGKYSEGYNAADNDKIF
jgi:hypothetical protein